MGRYIFSLFYIILLFVSVPAQTTKRAPAPKPDAAVQRLRGTVSYLASNKLEGRRSGTRGATAAAGFIASEFGKIGLQAGVALPTQSAKPAKGFLQEFSLNVEGALNPAAAYNVIGVLQGNDFLLKNEAIIIGAHYDHVGRGGKSSLAANSAEIHHGADDNASGVAGLLEIARTLKSEKKNRRTIIFIAFGGEEEGLLGSRFYVNNPAFPLEKTVAMINLDMIGRLKENRLTIGGVGTASEWKNLIETKNIDTPNKAQPKALSAPSASYKHEGVIGAPINVSVNLPLFSLLLDEDGFGPSDHASFYAKQIPVLFFFSGSHADYHKPSDTAEKINYEGLKQITNFVAEIVRAVDRSDKRPTYIAAKASAPTGGRMSFNVSLGTIPGYGENTNDGLLLEGVREDSPAAKAGIKAGDKIIRLAGKEIRNITDYTAVLSELKAGEEYEIEIRRGAEVLKLKIIPAARP
ncbi:MAG TPA: M20/M25/M40 family metallo-hydrolase [Pyrinomonadaceae bacterium]|nr:M20/M25/M40 family metallo-hydrolase [Pyrinomonadaceae bacterium]